MSDVDLESASTLDLGCGNNIHPDADIGVDINAESDAKIVGDVTKENLPFEKNSLNRVYAHDVVEHLGNRTINAFAEVHRVLKPGGLFEILVPGRFADPPSTNPHHTNAFRPEWFYSWDPERYEHNKWDNFKCVPFRVKQTEVFRVGSDVRFMIKKLLRQHPPYWPWRALKRKFELQKRTTCPHHDIYSE